MSSAKPKILLLGEIEQYAFTPPPPLPTQIPIKSQNTHSDNGYANSAQARTEFDSLSSLAYVITPKSSKPADFLSECRSGAFDGAKAVYRTFQSVEITGRIEGGVVEALAAAGVRFIAHNGAGYDQYVPPPPPTHLCPLPTK